MDDIDLEILRRLRDNSRTNASVIGEKIGMSTSAVIERIKKLEALGIVRKYTVALNAKLIGMDVLAFVSIGVEHPKHNDDFIKAVNKNRNVIECHYITGDFDFLLKIMTESIDSLTATLDSIKSIRGVSLTRTLIVLSTSKNDYCALPGRAEDV